MVNIPFIWPVSMSGDQIAGYLVMDKIPIMTTSMKQEYIVDLVRSIISNETMPRFRVAVLNSDETIKYYFPDADLLSSGSYQENYQTTGQRRSLSFSLINREGKYTPSIFNLWENTKVQFEAGLYSYLYGATVYFRQGIFVIQDVSVSRSNESSTVQFSCSDKYAVFEDNRSIITDSYEIEYGQDIYDLVTDILTTQLGNGMPIDPKPINYHSSFLGRKTEQTISANSGGHWSDILQSCATMLSAEMFYDANGCLTFIPTTEVVQDDSKPLIADYTDYNGDVISNSFSFDYKTIVNYIKVIGGTVNGHTCTATAKNDDPSSPININRIGYHYGSPISDNNITSDINAQERADYELRLKTIFSTSFTIPTKYNPIITVNNLVAYSSPFFQMEKERFLVSGVQYDLDYNGQMSLTVSNIKNLPFLTPNTAKIN